MNLLKILILVVHLFCLTKTLLSNDKTIDIEMKKLLKLSVKLSRAQDFSDVVYITHPLKLDERSLREILESDIIERTKYLKKIISKFHKLLQAPYVDLLTEQEKISAHDAQLHLIHKIRKQLRHEEKKATKSNHNANGFTQDINKIQGFDINSFVEFIKYYDAHVSVGLDDEEKGLFWAIEKMENGGRIQHPHYLYLRHDTSRIFQQIIYYENPLNNFSQLLSEYFVTLALFGNESSSRLGHEFLKEGYQKLDSYLRINKPLVLNANAQKSKILKDLLRVIKIMTIEFPKLKKYPSHKLRFQNIFLFLSLHPTDEFVKYLFNSLQSRSSMKLYGKISKVDHLLSSSILKMTDPKEMILENSSVSPELQEKMKGLRNEVIEFYKVKTDFKKFRIKGHNVKYELLLELKERITSPLKRCQNWFEDNF